MTIECKIFGPESLDVADRLFKLALILNDLGRTEEALKHSQECILMRRRLLGDEHLLLADALEQSGLFLYGLDRFNETLVFFKESYYISKNLSGDADVDTLRKLSNVHIVSPILGLNAVDTSLKIKILMVKKELFDHL